MRVASSDSEAGEGVVETVEQRAEFEELEQALYFGGIRREPERGIDPAGNLHLRQRVEADHRVAELARAVDRRYGEAHTEAGAARGGPDVEPLELGCAYATSVLLCWSP